MITTRITATATTTAIAAVVAVVVPAAAVLEAALPVIINGPMEFVLLKIKLDRVYYMLTLLKRIPVQ